MFCSSTRVTVAATQSGMTRSRCGFPHGALVSAFPFGSTTRVIAIGFEYMPPAAIVAYADAISSGVTPIEPSVIDGTASRGSSSDDRMPSFCAIVTMLPEYVCSYVWTFHAQFGSFGLHVESGW